MKVEIYSDVACPWCYIGKRRFEKALAEYPAAGEVEVVYRPFQLNPQAPATAVPLTKALAKKFGPQAESLAQHVADTALGEGIRMDFGKALSANTLAAYRRDLTLYADWLASHAGKSLDASTEHDLLGYAVHRADTKATSSNRRLTVFRRYFRWALRERLVALLSSPRQSRANAG